MTLNLSMPGQEDLKPRITVFGVGGAGGNAVDNMIEKQLDGVEFVIANTDAQALQQARAPQKVQMGLKVTEGLGAGARPTIGAAAAEESIEQIVDHLAGAHMCFITAGMGGGTGTGAAPIIAQAARELGVLTVGVVTKPFQFEGAKRMRQAEDGVEALQKVVDTLIIIPNQNLFRLANEKTTFTEAFAMADDVLYQGVKGVTDLMVRPGLINLDFADVRAVMDEMGKAMMGTGEAEGEDRAVQAAEKAIANPLLDEISLEGAKGVLINITGGYDLTLFELDEAANKIREKVDGDANIIVGSTLDTEMEGKMRVSVVATGIDAVARSAEDMPRPRRSMSEPVAAPTPKPVADDAPAAAAPAMAHAPEPARVQVRQVEPELFPEPQAVVPRPALRDDLPPPAYSPEPQDAPVAQPVERANVDSFDHRSVGTPSPETLARLRAAVAKVPEGQSNQAQRPEPQAGQAHGEDDRPRFGIGNLINRMSGHVQPGDQQRSGREEPQMRSSEETQARREIDPEQERIEVPAFLRRQAN